MKKIYMIISMMLLTMFAAMAQAPEKISYQAVVRNANNQLITNANVGVRVSVLQGAATGSAVYAETHTVNTNANGLLTLEIGGGNAQQGSFSNIDWGSSAYYLKTEIDPNGGTNYSITSTQQLMSVPYALYAKTASNGFSGNIADYLTPATTPALMDALQQAGVALQSDIPNVPENVSAFNNDAGYITAVQLPVIPENQVLSISNDTIFLTNGGFVKLPAATAGFSGDYNDLQNKPELFDGNYNSLTNKPEIPTVPTNISAFQNDAGYITADDIPEIPTSISDLTNDANYITESVLEEKDYITVNDIPEQVNADWNATEGAAKILNKPELFSGNYNDLQNKPQLFDGNYNSLSNKPEIPTVPTNVSEFTNDAGYITADDIPEIPTNISDLTNDAGFITEADVQAAANIPENISAFTNDAGYITADDIPEIPTSISDLANDANYITESVLEGKDYITVNDIPEQVNADWNATEGAAQILNKPELFSGNYNDLQNKPELFDGNYNSLSNKPEIPTVPTNVSEFTNDAGYITADDIPEIPTNISDLTNDAGFITEADVQAAANIPENISAFTNDAGYITADDIPEIPTSISDLANDANYITESVLEGKDYITVNDIPEQVNADWNATEGAAQILNKPTIPSMEVINSKFDSINNRINELMQSLATAEQLNQKIQELENKIDSLNNEIFVQIPFECGISKVKDVDGNYYKTVLIGNQCWLSENLRTKTYPDGTPITGFGYPGNNSGNEAEYGLLYSWSAATNGEESSASVGTTPWIRGICPEGWHMPTSWEFEDLKYLPSEFICGEVTPTHVNYNVAKSLASTTGWNASTAECAVGNNPSLNNKTGFDARPAGYNSTGMGVIARFWGAETENNSTGSSSALELEIYYPAPNIYVGYYNKATKMSVRCVRG